MFNEIRQHRKEFKDWNKKQEFREEFERIRYGNVLLKRDLEEMRQRLKIRRKLTQY